MTNTSHLTAPNQSLAPQFRYLERTYSQTSQASTAVFSDCNSVRSNYITPSFPTTTKTTTKEPSDVILNSLVASLSVTSTQIQLRAVTELRCLAKNNPENRVLIARAGAVQPLLALFSSPDAELEENGVTCILNLLICEENKNDIVAAGAIDYLVKALCSGRSAATRGNAACALLRIATPTSEHHEEIGKAGAIPPLVELLRNGEKRGKKDAATALYAVLSTVENKRIAVEAGIVKVLLGLMEDTEFGMVDKASYVLNKVVMVAEGRAAMVAEGGIGVLVEMVESGSEGQKKMAILSLSEICQESMAYRKVVTGECAVPALLAICHSGASEKNKIMAEELIRLLRQPKAT